MKACGLIVEYNPYHNGHRYHLQQSKQQTNADCIVAVMSGNFLQRGEPAIVDKFTRAKMAINQGVDLVVELPYHYAVQHSELFAKGAVALLETLHVEHLVFGSEHGQIEDFVQMANLQYQYQDTYEAYVKHFLQQGVRYPVANQLAFESIHNDRLAIDVTKPNNILGYQYVKQTIASNGKITPHTIQRIKSQYHDQHIEQDIASATSIRNQLQQQKQMTKLIENTLPLQTVQLLTYYQQHYGKWHFWEDYFPLLHHKVLTSSPTELRQIHEVREGIEHRLYHTAKQATSFQDWMEKLKTKRYTWTSLQRMFTHILTHTTKTEIQSLLASSVLPIRVLAMTNIGQTYLRSIKKEIKAPFFTSIKSPFPLQESAERISNAYYGIQDPHIQPMMRNQEYQQPIQKTM
ncbi:hypothetical protein J416_01349 [Gracilibacillus halophilus YIM-C55.5]|uniref:tRNA(Met) cytidine acetate ligase n=1 Tax=Gracilibacillus halophilus YIM-C55.5 TaxID=1308866 RepID=N4WDJ1_9BACI|nr:nucleotidyltransferase [Gracilibacillus halophilus]ENH98343.1 hypothetical protein J416_01349 [Gracilibacillus halophilus YIM-C55.5]